MFYKSLELFSVSARSRMILTLCCALAIFLLPMMAKAASESDLLKFWDDSEEQSLFDVNHSPWDDLLKKYVSRHISGVNRFDYDSVSDADKRKLANYLKIAQQMDPRQLTRVKQKAYWLNLFNAGVVMQVLESQPEKSIKEISKKKLWRKKRFSIAMQKLSLDDVEHGIVRPIFKDPRVHFALVGGALGSPNIIDTAYTYENMEELLESNTREFLAHSRGVDYDGQRLTLSSIFKWYESDFGGDFESTKRFLIKYLPPEKKVHVRNASRASYNYDWGLNSRSSSIVAAE